MNLLKAIPTCNFYHPRNNLVPQWATTDPEAKFSSLFAHSYDKGFRSHHSGSLKLHRLLVQEVPVNGFGISDLVAVSWYNNQPQVLNKNLDIDELLELRPTIRAFEVKLNNWRKGLMQAHRYSFFADVSILVVPSHKLHLVKKYIDTFSSLRVGLWGYNEFSSSITKVYTPRPKQPYSKEHRRRVVKQVISTAMQFQPSP